MSTENLPDSLRATYILIKNQAFVKEPSCALSDSDIVGLQELINSCQPTTPEDQARKAVVRLIFTRLGREGFYELMKKMGMFSLVLWTDSRMILGHFKLNKRIYMKYVDGKYEVGRRLVGEE
jgi:hypothetical protein